MPKLAAAERVALVDLLQDLGPDAPTLCEGWQTRHLAAHLVTREGRPTALAGVLVPRLHGYTARLEAETLAGSSYPDLLQAVAAGPPLGPVGVPGMAEAANVHEFFVHHEDVRRAQPQWTVRHLSDELEAALRRRLWALAPVLIGRLPGTRLHLTTPDGRHRTIGHGRDDVTVTGEIGELFLYAFGRRGAAQVSVTGSPAGQARLAAADLRQ